MDAPELQAPLLSSILFGVLRRQKGAVEAAGYESGEGFIKLPYNRALPTELLETLMRARVSEFEAQQPN